MLLLNAIEILGRGIVWLEAVDMSAVRAIFATSWTIFFSAAGP